MSFIYCITNDINGKQYVGKTNRTVEKRFGEHRKDMKREGTKNFPLYRAMNKYGVDHFHITSLEKCLPDESCEREIYWIDKLDTYHNGYNATKGGDGAQRLDYNKIISLWDNTKKTGAQIARECNCHVDSVYNVIKQYRQDADFKKRAREIIAAPVIGIKKKNKIKCYFPSISKAEKFLRKKSRSSHISQACKGERQTAYGYEWHYYK